MVVVVGLHSNTARTSSDLYDEFWVGVGESLKLVLVQVHNEELVCGRQLHRHLGELLVEVADVTTRFLPREGERRRVSIFIAAVQEVGGGGRHRKHIDGKGRFIVSMKSRVSTRCRGKFSDMKSSIIFKQTLLNF